ncbi:hypothetical protein Vretifemale_4869 [Volvox reticuliferus]|uniref:SUMO-activating enzyme subunit n=1 Tax=Volvox reticuliferus TaxID=1737510 RepID=A0A8J4C3Z6_9CHLO|nr:hypothetical protein Vretifemale_4869 [Volvox reticuliferus]
MAVDTTKWLSALRTKELQDKIKSAKVLCVGAGGIGCELLKTLVCTGFRNIEVVDLDTIEISNLNRQFLFRKHHVGQSKAITAAQVVKGFCPTASITAHHANMKESHFDVDFFRGFDLVLNGLDNLEARRHVNRLCLAAERPLVESGTAGYLGQVTVHLKGSTECFECHPKPTPKSFPICTLRNTPDRPIHTIVWAKDLLFNRLFGRPDAVSDLDDQARREDGQNSSASANDGDAAASAAAAAASDVPAEDPSFFLRRDGESSLEYAARVFERVYTWDIEQLCGVKELWEKRPPPKPMRLEELLPDTERAAVGAALETAIAKGQGSASRALGLNNASQKWTASQNAAVLLLAIAMYHDMRKEEVGSASFDKDDDLAVDFVTSASNLRSSCYGIPEQSLFDAKGMAGNIIHAIATTNAIISGLIVIEALKILAGCQDAVRNTFLNEFPPNKRLLLVQNPEPPSKGCMVCGKATLTLKINSETATLSSLLSGVIKKRLAVNTPNLLCGGFLYEEGEGLEEDEVEAYTAMLPRTLASLPGGGLRHGSILTVQDQSQHFGVDIIIVHTEDLNEEDAPEGFVLEGDVPAAPKEVQHQHEQPQAAAAAAAMETMTTKTRASAEVKEEDGVLILDEDEEQVEVHDSPAPLAAAEAHSRKRALREDEEYEESTKREAKRTKLHATVAIVEAVDDDDVILIEDD